jgi:hypothetical protein
MNSVPETHALDTCAANRQLRAIRNAHRGIGFRKLYSILTPPIPKRRSILILGTFGCANAKLMNHLTGWPSELDRSVTVKLMETSRRGGRDAEGGIRWPGTSDLVLVTGSANHQARQARHVNWCGRRTRKMSKTQTNREAHKRGVRTPSRRKTKQSVESDNPAVVDLFAAISSRRTRGSRSQPLHARLATASRLLCSIASL